MKAYIVTVGAEIIVTAPSPEAALTWAARNRWEYEHMIQTDTAAEFRPGSVIPGDWDEDSLVFGDHDGDASVADLLATPTPAEGENGEKP